MFNCFKKKTIPISTPKPTPKMAKKGDLSEVCDLEDVVTRWAKEVWNITKTKDQAKIQKEFLQFNINWKHVKFIFDPPSYNMLPFIGKSGPGASGTKGGEIPKNASQPQVLFRTVFTNDTNQDQEYSFKTERTTRSTCTICIEHGFSRGFDFGLKLTTPCEVLEAAAGFKREISVMNIGEDTIEEELTWGVDSQVKVPPHTETQAELVITEAQCQGSFAMHTRFHGRIIVTVTNIKENNSLVTVLEGNIADIMSNEIHQRQPKGVKMEGNKCVSIETRGKCNFKFGIEQLVKITERTLSPMEQ